MPLHGWYSETQRGMWGYGYYKTPLDKMVTVTHVTTGSDHGTQLTDIKYVGVVVDMVQSFFFKSAEERNFSASSIVPKAAAPIDAPHDEEAAPVFCPYKYWNSPPCKCGRCPIPPEDVAVIATSIYSEEEIEKFYRKS